MILLEQNNKKKTSFSVIWELFIVFLRIGAFTFGGGYAMIPLIQKEVCEKKKWLTEEDILEIVAIAESTPGPIAINAATFIGYRIAGFFGSFFCTLGVVLPSFLIITLISYVLKEFQEFRAVQYAFFGIRAGVLALLIKALYSMYKQMKKNAVSYIVAGLAFIFATFVDINVLFVIIGCAVIGLVYSFIAKKKEGAE